MEEFTDLKKKKYLLAIYYIGLICGALVMNYALINHEEITSEWFHTFLNLDNLKYVKKQELCFYVLYKRLKQIVLCSIVYRYISKIGLFLFLLFYGAFIMGLTVSLFVYYKGIGGILYSIYIIGPLCLIYGSIIYWILLRKQN